MNALSVRTKLTAWYGGLFLVAGLVLVVIDYLLVQSTLPDPARFADMAVSGTSSLGVTREMVEGGAAAPAVRLVSGSLDEYRDST